MSLFNPSRRVGLSTSAVTVLPNGQLADGRQAGMRCAVKGCHQPAVFFCQRRMGENPRSPAALVAVLGYCEPHSAKSERFQRETWEPWQ